MNETEKLIYGGNPKSITEYFSLNKKIEQEKLKGKIDDKKNIKIALLSSFTINGIKEVLNVKCFQSDIVSDFYVAPYNQYLQQIIDKNSQLYKFEADIIIVFIDSKSLLGEYFYFPYRLTDTERKDYIGRLAAELITSIRYLKDNSKSKIVLHNFEVPLYSTMGILESKMAFGFMESVQSLNNKLKDEFKNDAGVFLFDYDTFCSKYGKKNICDPKMYYLADLKLDFSFIAPLCENYLSYIKPLLNMNKKCLVLDLDNVLWDGILGEDGLEGIKLGPTGEGKPFFEFQKLILGFYERGVILAINSHNNYNDVEEVFKNHPYMILKEKHFATLKINWEDKISNMKAIAQEINIGLDSLVFIDDDKLNRELIKDALPEVSVIDLPEDPSLFPVMLSEINDFNVLQLTQEDMKRGRMYAEQRKRQEFQKFATDITEFLKGLEIVVTIEKVNPLNIARIAQLTQRTNQFNMTTRRYHEEDIKKIDKSGNFLIASVKVEDKFGDNGIAGAVIVKKEDNKWRIDTFLLSCRVIGRRVEEALLAYIVEQAKKENGKILIGEFIPTKKNIPAKEFYKNNDFTLVKNENGIEIWSYDVNKDYKYPEFIKIVKKNIL